MVWHWLKVVRGALIFTAFYLAGAVFGSAFLATCSLFERDPIERQRRARIACGNVFRFVLDCLRWCRIFNFDARQVAPRLPGHPVIVIANHPTTIDVVATLAVYREAVVVVKHKIWTDPFLSRMFRWCGHIPGGDGSFEANATILSEVRQRLNQGLSVVIFPEGTRSPAGGLGTMHRGAFLAATTTQADILPVLITCDPPALHRDAPWHKLPREPVNYQLHPQPVMPVAGRSARQLQRDVMGLYRSLLGLPTPQLHPVPAVRPAPFTPPAASDPIASSG